METTLTIKGIVPAQSSAGRVYWKVNTDQGNMTCFEEKVAEYLMNNINKSVRLEIAKSGRFTNIRGIKKPVEVVKVGEVQKDNEEVKTYKYPRVSREKLAEGLCEQAVHLASFAIVDEKPIALEKANKLVWESYKFFLDKVKE